VKSQSIWIEASEHLDQLFAAHAVAIGQLRNAPRTCVSHFAKKDKQGNPIPDYADLATVIDTARAALSANGLSVTQSFMPYGEDGTLMLVTTLGHKGGQFQRSFLPMKGNVPPQSLASTATYLKRVAFCAIVGIAADNDDDGAQANASHAAATVSDEPRIVSALIAKIRAATSKKARDAEIVRARKGVSEGMLSEKSLDALRDLASALDEKETESKKEPAVAT
jgi:hypothetical protein